MVRLITNTLGADGQRVTIQAPKPHPLVTDQDPRCWRCGRLLAVSLTRPWHVRCERCKADNRSLPPPRQPSQRVIE